MKKYLPFFVFIGTFAGSLFLQVGYQTLMAKTDSKALSKYELYEREFSDARYTNLDGKIIEPKKLKAPVIIYNFWASWCNPCLEEMPSLIELKKKYKDDEVVVISLNTDENNQIKNIKKTLSKFNIQKEFEVIPDLNTKVADSLKITAIPVTIVFNRGKVVQFENGPMDFNSSEFNEKLKKWIKN